MRWAARTRDKAQQRRRSPVVRHVAVRKFTLFLCALFVVGAPAPALASVAPGARGRILYTRNMNEPRPTASQDDCDGADPSACSPDPEDPSTDIWTCPSPGNALAGSHGSSKPDNSGIVVAGIAGGKLSGNAYVLSTVCVRACVRARARARVA